MAVTIFKGGKYRILSGKKIKKGSEWVTLPKEAKIKANGKWHDLSFSKTTVDFPEIEIPEIQLPSIELPDFSDSSDIEFPPLEGPFITKENFSN